MYFVCPSCRTALRVNTSRLPQRLVRYRCKSCGTASVVQENLHPSPPAPARPEPAPEPVPDGTVYHHVSDLQHLGVPRASYELILEVETQDGRKEHHAFQESRVTVGRGNARVRVPDPLVSRVHLEIERIQDRVIVKDLGSTNGTRVNDRTISAEFVTENDEIRIGNTRIRVRVEMC